VVAAVQDFAFMGGSLGMAAGEAIVTSMLKAVEKEAPYILFAASGGARMQEGMFSLMQMPRTTVAVQKLREARLPYIVVLTHPTTGGVTASYAMLGDVHIAEPGAQRAPGAHQQRLDAGNRRVEYLLEHGMVDIVVHRHQLRETLSRLSSLLMERRELKRRVEPAADGSNSPGDQPRIVIDNQGRLGASEAQHQAANDPGDQRGTVALPPPEKAAAE